MIIKTAGTKAVLARSFARIFYRKRNGIGNLRILPPCYKKRQ